MKKSPGDGEGGEKSVSPGRLLLPTICPHGACAERGKAEKFCSKVRCRWNTTLLKLKRPLTESPSTGDEPPGAEVESKHFSVAGTTTTEFPQQHTHPACFGHKLRQNEPGWLLLFLCSQGMGWYLVRPHAELYSGDLDMLDDVW